MGCHHVSRTLACGGWIRHSLDVSRHHHKAVVERLRGALATGDLPGHVAQGLMSARPPRIDWETDMVRIPTGTRRAGVLVLLYPPRAGAESGPEGGTTVALMLRAETPGSHSGQVSFPGGALEEGETPAQGALREAWEELSLEPASVAVLGVLTPLHIPVSSFLVHPVIGAAPEPPQLIPEPTEVAAVLEVGLDELMAPHSTRWAWMERPRGKLLVPYFPVRGFRVWGATAMILSELLTILGWEGPTTPERA